MGTRCLCCPLTSQRSVPPRSFEICPVFSLGGRGVGDDEERYGGGGEVEADDAALAGEAPVGGEKNRYNTGTKDTESGTLGDDMRSALLVNFELVGSSSSEIKRRPDWSQNSSMERTRKIRRDWKRPTQAASRRSAGPRKVLPKFPRFERQASIRWLQRNL